MERIRTIIDENRPDLLERINPNEMFLSELVKRKVVVHSTYQELEVKYNMSDRYNR